VLSAAAASLETVDAIVSNTSSNGSTGKCGMKNVLERVERCLPQWIFAGKFTNYSNMASLGTLYHKIADRSLFVGRDGIRWVAVAIP